MTASLGSFAKETTDNPVSKEFAKLAEECGLKCKGRGFYALRHSFRTAAGGAKDVEATRVIMGHEEHAVEDSYIEGVDDDRLLAVGNHVREWLYSPGGKDGDRSTEKTGKRAAARQTKGKQLQAPKTDSGEVFQLRIVG